ncbi:Arylsulfatase A [Rubritalea squalenifaciens DSM 18772]|uniref:Arylsulfatase A n=2 Tax=Rubritalea squalenifaciens TaxID=407226 RepID=A0A1M6QHS3_9BACT|nr:Arylsulfatase A [Rubritalea squalenifaciens DSM 18772]
MTAQQFFGARTQKTLFTMKLQNPRLVAAVCLSLQLSGSALESPLMGISSPAGPAAIALSWEDMSTSETGFEIERHGGDNSWALVATVPANSTHYYDRGLSEQSTYSYRVRAIDSGSSSAWHDLGSATTTLKMNIIFFLADDMGYKDIAALRNPSIDGPSIYETPALDQLVSDGVSIDNAYCSGPRCVVARRSILTGKYDWRPEAVPNNDFYIDHDGDPIGGGIYAGGTTVSGSQSGAGVTIPDNETYGEALQSAGYRTCYIGKYHLGESPSLVAVPGYTFGDQPARGPRQQGFDVSIASGHAGAPPASYFSVENQHATGSYTFELPDLDDTSWGTSAPIAGEYITDRLTQKAIGFISDSISNHASDPFCMTLAHYAVHTPAEAKTTDIDYFKSKKQGMASTLATHPMASTPLITDYSSKTRMIQDNVVYAAMLKSYDDSLASLRAYLATTDDPRNPGKKLSETTIIVVSSDHGGKSTTPIADGKSLEDDSTDPVNPAPTYVESKGAYKSGTPNAYSSYPTSNYPFRQGKTWVYEGGLKIPLIVYYPGVTPAGSHSSSFVHGADFFASFVDMAGGSQSSESSDSVSFMLSAALPELSARKDLHHFFTNANTGTGNPALAAYRKGDYKLLYFMVQRKVELYNLAADIYEQNDISEIRPDLAKEMLHQVYQQFLETGAKMPKPGSNTWKSEQEILVSNGVISALPTPPDAAPSNLTVTQLSETALQLDWTVNATNATHAIIYRSSPDEDGTYREIAYVPVSQTSYIDTHFTSIVGQKYKYRIELENLGGWNGFSIDASGEFSSGSSNNGVTNTGNTVHTLVSDDALALQLNDDDITSVPGEERIIYPLLNDLGEGQMTITSITQPSTGYATTDGETVTFHAPAEFAGGITIDYTVSDSASQTDTATLYIELPDVSTETGLVAWEFDDAATTQLENTTSTTGISFTGTTSANVATDGSGLLVLSNDTKNHNRTSQDITATPYENGSYRFRFRVQDVDLSNADNGAAFGFSFRDQALTSDFGIVRFKKSGSDIILEVRNNNPANNNAVTLHTIAGLTINDAVVTSTLDLDNKTISTSLELNGGAAIDLADATAYTGAQKLDTIKFQANTNSAGALQAKIDYFRVFSVATEGPLYQAWSGSFDWNGVKDILSTDDPDKDGLSNFVEFSMGTSPLNPNSPEDIFTLVPQGDGLALQFTPFRNTSAISYKVLFSDDLVDWGSISSVTISSSAGQSTTVPLPTLTKAFSKIQIKETLN